MSHKILWLFNREKIQRINWSKFNKSNNKITNNLLRFKRKKNKPTVLIQIKKKTNKNRRMINKKNKKYNMKILYKLRVMVKVKVMWKVRMRMNKAQQIYQSFLIHIYRDF